MTNVMQKTEVTLYFDMTATSSETDFGVPGSPVFEIIDDVELQSVEIDGEDYTYRDLVQWFGQYGADAIVKLGIDSLDEDDWV